MLQGMRASAKYIWWFVAATFLIGFVFVQQSGLSDRLVTAGTTVAKVNGTAITYDQYQRAIAQREQTEEQNGHTINADERRMIEDRVYNEMVNDVLLQQEYARRGISVTDAEIAQAAIEQPYPPLARNAEFQTDGQFDRDKYQRYLSSPAARQEGLLAMLDDYYRQGLLKSKLFEQLATSVYVTDDQLWRLYRDSRDSAKVTYVSLPAAVIPDSAVKVSDAEIAAYFEKHKKELTDVPGHAVISVARLPRLVTAADTAAARNRALAARAEILKGAKFADVAKRESADTGSAAQGGELGKFGRNTMVKPFTDAAFALKVGEISGPVLTPFGFHIIKLESKQGDSATAAHILFRIQQGDSAASATDRRADQLAKAGGATNPSVFDSAAKALGLATRAIKVQEGVAASFDGIAVPGASAWAFSGPKPGEIGELIDADDAYYLVRLDSLTVGGAPTLAALKPDIHALLAREKKLDLLMPKAQQIAAASKGSTLEQAAIPAGYAAIVSPFFSRSSQVVGLGMGNAAIGAAFGLPLNVVGEPVKSTTAVIVERVDARHLADSAAFEKDKVQQRLQVQQRIREQAVQQYVQNLRMNASITDKRKEIQAAQRQPTS